MSGRTKLWTIGHSNHEAGHFLGLLEQHGIEAVADVRSQPYARYTEHFSQAPLRRLLVDADVTYVFLGKELGGRPQDPDLYDDAGFVLYGDVAETGPFREGLRRLLKGAASCRVAMMCSEEDPAECHRRLLVTRALLDSEASLAVMHIRGDGQIVSEEEIASAEAAAGEQLNFFGDANLWKSAQSVSPSTAHRASLIS